MFSTARYLLITSLAVSTLVLPGCSDDADENGDSATSSTTAPGAPTPDASDSSDDASGSTSSTTSESGDSAESTTTAAGSDTGCWVHLYDEDRFDERDPNFRLSEPGRYATLKDLPGATQDWNDEADSIRVGPNATVTIWPRTDFQATSEVLQPGSEHPDVAEEPMSLELAC